MIVQGDQLDWKQLYRSIGRSKTTATLHGCVELLSSRTRDWPVWQHLPEIDGVRPAAIHAGARFAIFSALHLSDCVSVDTSIHLLASIFYMRSSLVPNTYTVALTVQHLATWMRLNAPSGVPGNQFMGRSSAECRLPRTYTATGRTH